MKKFNTAMLFVMALVGVVALSIALDDVTIPADFYDGARAKTATDAVAARVTVIETASVVPVDTNAVTTTSVYTPAKVGGILIGQTGPGTNGVWISKGLTTNDWVQVAP